MDVIEQIIHDGIDATRELNKGLAGLGLLLLCTAPQRAPKGSVDGAWYIRECCTWYLVCRVEGTHEILISAHREQGDAAAFIEALT